MAVLEIQNSMLAWWKGEKYASSPFFSGNPRAPEMHKTSTN